MIILDFREFVKKYVLCEGGKRTESSKPASPQGIGRHDSTARQLSLGRLSLDLRLAPGLDPAQDGPDNQDRWGQQWRDHDDEPDSDLGEDAQGGSQGVPCLFDGLHRMPEWGWCGRGS